MSDYKVISIRLKVSDYEAMQKQAGKENLKLSTWVKWILSKHIEKQGSKDKSGD